MGRGKEWERNETSKDNRSKISVIKGEKIRESSS